MIRTGVFPTWKLAVATVLGGLVGGLLLVWQPCLPAQQQPTASTENNRESPSKPSAQAINPELLRQLIPTGPPSNSQTTKESPDSRQQSSLVNELQRELEQQLQAAAIPEEQNPLLEILQQMHYVVGLLEKKDPGPQTQQIQQDIVRRLDELLASASQQQVTAQQPTGTPQQQPSSQPRQANTTSPRPMAGTGRSRADQTRTTARTVEELLHAVWGELPARVRESIPMPTPENFLPRYRELIEDYYRHLLEVGTEQ